MTRKQRRLWTVVGGLVVLGAAAALVLNAMQDNIVYYYTPSKLAESERSADRNLRLGGLVMENSVLRRDDGPGADFIVTDGTAQVPVHYNGLLPDLFREGQGVIAEGRLDANGVFVADKVLAKHDENYMPPEIAEALKDSGAWKGNDAGYAPDAETGIDTRAMQPVPE